MTLDRIMYKRWTLLKCTNFCWIGDRGRTSESMIKWSSKLDMALTNGAKGKRLGWNFEIHIKF